jgi:hypothetical protein
VGEHFARLLERLGSAFVLRPRDIDVLLAAVDAAVERLRPGSRTRRRDELA